MTAWVDLAGYGLARFIQFLLMLIPPSSAIAIGKFLGQCFFYFSSRRRVAYADIKAALGTRFNEKERWQILRRHYGHMGQMLVEVLLIPKWNREILEKHIEIKSKEQYQQLTQEKEGLIFITGHFGNWELIQIISGILGRPINVLARDQKHRRLDAFLNQLRETHGAAAIRKGIGIRDLMRGLRRNEMVGILGDQDAGKYEGVIVPFFGRKTTVPTGSFELANRTGAPIYPCYLVRREGLSHDVYIEDKIAAENPDQPGVLEIQVQRYLRSLEKYICEYPEQWLWETKRWKYSWTKRLLILSDGKTGHLRQCEAVAASFQKVTTQHGRSGMEYPTQTLFVEFQSKFHQIIFPWVALILMPWIQGRLNWITGFFKPQCREALIHASADFILSAGNHLVPLNLLLARDSRAKSIVLMKPSFPFNFFHYDLALIPEHDRGLIPDEAIRTKLTPSLVAPEKLSASADKMKHDLRDPRNIKFAIFLGGQTRRFQMHRDVIQCFFEKLLPLAERHGDFLVTTSRRTPPEVEKYLKEKIAPNPYCQLLVIAREDKRTEMVSGMMAFAEYLIVTEDSVSMISEAVLSGKKVIVLNLDSGHLPGKHRRFKEILSKEQVIVTASPEEISEKILTAATHANGHAALKRQEEVLQKRLQEIL